MANLGFSKKWQKLLPMLSLPPLSSHCLLYGHTFSPSLSFISFSLKIGFLKFSLNLVWLGSLTVTCRTCNPEVTQKRRFDSARGHWRVTTLGKLFTHVPLSPSSIIWYRLHRLDGNRHAAQYTGPVSVVLQCKIWCLAEGLRKRRSAPLYGP